MMDNDYEDGSEDGEEARNGSDGCGGGGGGIGSNCGGGGSDGDSGSSGGGDGNTNSFNVVLSLIAVHVPGESRYGVKLVPLLQWREAFWLVFSSSLVCSGGMVW